MMTESEVRTGAPPAPPDRGVACGEGWPVRLRDGTALIVRPMRDDDGARLVAFHESLSPETQYLRFFSSHAHLSAREVDWFTHVDHRRREALVAVVDGEIVGVVRFDRIPDSSDAEVAFVVADRLQGRGLGTLLMAEIATVASAVGIERLVAETLLHNDRMLAVFHHCGLPVGTRFADGVVNVAVELPPRQ